MFERGAHCFYMHVVLHGYGKDVGVRPEQRCDASRREKLCLDLNIYEPVSELSLVP